MRVVVYVFYGTGVIVSLLLGWAFLELGLGSIGFSPLKHTQSLLMSTMMYGVVGYLIYRWLRK